MWNGESELSVNPNVSSPYYCCYYLLPNTYYYYTKNFLDHRTDRPTFKDRKHGTSEAIKTKYKESAVTFKYNCPFVRGMNNTARERNKRRMNEPAGESEERRKTKWFTLQFKRFSPYIPFFHSGDPSLRSAFLNTFNPNNKHFSSSQRRSVGFSWVRFKSLVQKPCQAITRLINLPIYHNPCQSLSLLRGS